MREQLQVVMGNRTFLIVLAINFTIRFILAVLVAVLPFYADYVLRIEGEQLTQLLIVLFAAAGLSLVLWQRVISRVGSRSAMIASMLLTASFAVLLLFSGSLLTTTVVLGLLGFTIGGAVLGPDLLFAEVVDEDYVRTGLRREGMYRGILGFIFRFPPALAGLILGEGLALAGFDADLAAAEQPEAVIMMIRGFSAVLPLGAVLIGVALLWLYPLYGPRLREVQRQAAALREAASRGPARPAEREPRPGPAD